MIIRIVRMEFQSEALMRFHSLFDQHKQAIRNFPGCLHLELHKDASQLGVRYTYSHWNSEADLDAYRHSDLFAQVWPRTKALFAAPPLAYSLLHMEEVPASNGRSN